MASTGEARREAGEGRGGDAMMRKRMKKKRKGDEIEALFSLARSHSARSGPPAEDERKREGG